MHVTPWVKTELGRRKPPHTYHPIDRSGGKMATNRLCLAALVALLGLSPAACAHAPIVTPAFPPAAALAPTLPSQVRFYESAPAVPFEYVTVATITPRRAVREFDASTLQPYRELAA